MRYLQKVDKEVFNFVKREEKRQQQTLMMIPSENIASKAVEEAVGSVLENKYAEGYPFKRYYQGQEVVDEVETTTIERAKKLFGVPHVNVQPYSGSPANFAAISAVLKPGDTLMGLSLAFGGHLTHGASASATSTFFKAVQYELNTEGYIDYDEVEKLARKEKPQLIIAGTTAYPRLIDWKKFAAIAKSVNAYLMTDIAHIAGLIAAGVYPSPVPYAHIVTTTTHKTLRGPRGAMIMVTDAGLKKDPDLAKKVNRSVFPGLQGGPHLNTIAGIGVALKEASSPRFKKYAAQIVANAKVLAAELVKMNFQLISGGTDSHLILADLRNFGILGNTAAEGLEAVGIVLNRNSVPYDTNPPFFPSGIRLGTPGITTRGLKEVHMRQVAQWMSSVVQGLAETKKRLKYTTEDEKKPETRAAIIKNTKKVLQPIHKELLMLCKKYPIPPTY
jgi:glycine hydroxymethyltransferase